MRTTALAILSLLALASGATEPAPPPLSPPIVTLREPAVDFVTDADGRVWLFLYGNREQRSRCAVWDGHTWKDGVFPLNGYPGGSVRHALERKPGDWLLFVEGEYGARGLVRSDGTIHSDQGPLAFEWGYFRPFVTADGMLWMLSNKGVANGVRTDPKRLLPPHALIAEPEGTGKPFHFLARCLEIPGHGTWFWSQVQNETRVWFGVCATIPGFRVYDNGAWREVSLATDAGEADSAWLGGVALTKNGELLCGRRCGGFSLVSPVTGAETPLSIELPKDEHCLFLAALANGDLLTVTAEVAEKSRPPSPEHGGWQGTLLRIDGKTFKSRVLLTGVDFGDCDYPEERPWVETEAGVFLGSANSGLVFAPADGGPARRLDWQNGVPFPPVTKLRGAGDCLYLFDRERGFAVLNWRQLLETQPTPEMKRWEVEAIAARPVLAADGAVWYVTEAAPAELHRVKGKQTKRFLLRDIPFALDDLGYLTLDSKDRPWLISRFASDWTVFLDAGKWRTFATLEEAYETVAREEKGNPGFRVGTPKDDCFPAFAGDGRVAYSSQRRRICFFDGKRWEAPQTPCRDESQLEFDLEQGTPFYHGGILAAYHWRQKRCYLHRDGKWEPAPVSLQTPYLPFFEYGVQPNPPPSYPGPRDWGYKSSKVLDATGTLWAGSARDLYRGLGDTWVQVPTLFTPLSLPLQITDVLVDSSGDLWFAFDWNHRRLARYHPPDKALELKWAKPTPKVVAAPDTELRVSVEGVLPLGMCEYRFDNGDWKLLVLKTGQTDAVLSFPMLSSGKHICEVRAFDALLRASNTLKHEWEVRRDYAQETRDGLRLLSSADFATRQKASRLLADLGPSALPALVEARKSADKDLAWWLDAVLQEIRDRESHSVSPIKSSPSSQ